MNAYHMMAAIFWIESAYHLHMGNRKADAKSTLFAIVLFVIGEIKL